jgi:Ca2+-binding RTX toxin-like protein
MPAAGATFAHAYQTPGVYRVSVRAVDKDGGVSEPATAATTITVAGARVAPDPTDPTQTALIVGGTEGADSIVFRRPPPGTRGGGGKVEVLLNGQSLGVFNPTGRIIAFGRGGNDVIVAESQLSRSFMLFGGAGNDTILTGNGDSVLVGGDGIDVLNAGNGRDILIGGAGADRLTGGNGDDLLVAAATRYDGGTDENLRSLAAIQFEWLRTDRTYATRVNAIRNGGGLNGTNVFNAGTLIADAQRDTLLGGNGSDWFIADNMDVTDRRAGELLN